MLNLKYGFFLSIVKHKNSIQVESTKVVITAKKLIDILYKEIRNKFPNVYTSTDSLIIFEGPTIPRLRAWGLIELIPTGKIEIQESARLNLVSYDINFSKYVFTLSILFLIMTSLMLFWEFPILMIVISIPIFWIILALVMPILVTMRFDTLIRQCIDKAGGRIVRGV